MNFPPTTLEPIDASAKVHKPHRTKKEYGLLLLLGCFLWMRAADLAVVLYAFPKLNPYQKHQILGPMVVTATWTTLLLITIALRQQWARYVLAGTLFFVVISAWSTLPSLPDLYYPGRLFRGVLAITVAYLPVALTLILSQNIKKLLEK